jgi:hypothetical protein
MDQCREKGIKVPGFHNHIRVAKRRVLAILNTTSSSCFGLMRCNWKRWSAFKSYVWSSIVAANLLTIARANQPA